MATLKIYYYSENVLPTVKGRLKIKEIGKKYFLFKKEKQAGKTKIFCDSLEEIAKEVANSLFFYDDEGLAYDKVILYRGFDNKVEGKPKLLADKNKVVVSRTASSIDELYEIQKRVVEIIDRESAEEESEEI